MKLYCLYEAARRQLAMARAEATIKAAQKWRSCAAVGDYGEALKELDLCKVLVRAAQDAEPRGSEARKRWAVAGAELLESDRLLKGYLAALAGVLRCHAGPDSRGGVEALAMTLYA